MVTTKYTKNTKGMFSYSRYAYSLSAGLKNVAGRPLLALSFVYFVCFVVSPLSTP